DLPVLDQVRAIAGEPRAHECAWIDGADVPEARHEDPALGALDHVGHAGRAANHAERSAATESAASAAAAGVRRLLSLLLRPVAIVVQILHDPVLDPHALLARRAVSVVTAGGTRRIRGIRYQRHPLVDDLHPELVPAAGLREERPSLVGG